MAAHLLYVRRVGPARYRRRIAETFTRIRLPRGPHLVGRDSELRTESGRARRGHLRPIRRQLPPTSSFSEFHYHPLDPTAEELALGYVDESSFEFIEC